MCAGRDTTYPPQPLWKILPRSELIESGGKTVLEALLLHFVRGGRISTDVANEIIQTALCSVYREENVLRLEGKFTIVGDLHGQFYDLVKIIGLCGPFSTTRYLFLGNYIGGGGFNCEVLLFLLAAKAEYPMNVFFLRGPNECWKINWVFGFEEECVLKYNRKIFKEFQKLFQGFSLAAVLNRRFFCVHGGISKSIDYIEEINSIPRGGDIPAEGPMCDLLWADPLFDVENPVSLHAVNSDETYIPFTDAYVVEKNFEYNVKRGRSYLFNFASLEGFMQKNNLLCIIRSNEVEQKGYRLYRISSATNYPCMISVFSAPNYCGTHGNFGAVVSIAADITVKKFFCSPCPYALPKSNGFTWSLPFLMENVIDFFSRLFPEL